MKLRSATLAPILMAVEAAVCVAILFLVPYTEIDWVAYMQEVGGFLAGEMDYVKLRGDTGPLVYPAGFVYIYSALYYLTGEGVNVFLAQCVFAGLYLATVAVVFSIYRACRAPPLLLVVLVLSKRVHSIFLLRLFNDGVAMLLLYAAVVFFMRHRWAVGCLLYSAAVSVKMNIFLFAPALLFLLCRHMSIPKVVAHLALCAAVQLALGAPFLATYPVSYLSKAFELSRVFDYKWTVNLRFLPEPLFVDPVLGKALLAATLLTWVVLWRRRWVGRDYRDPAAVVVTLFESNLVGVVFARTLHYQFYSWFFHQLPLVLHLSTPGIPSLLRLAILVAVEVAFNVFPATWWSSALLMAALLTVWAGMVFGSDYRAAPRPGASTRPSAAQGVSQPGSVRPSAVRE